MRTYTAAFDGFAYEVDGMIRRADTTAVNTYVDGTTNSNTPAHLYTWDLSKSNSIFGKSNTVQPAATIQIPQIKY